MTDKKPIGLKELVSQVKEELLSDPDAASQPLFLIGQIELGISFTVERNAKGGISFHVVQGGAERKWTEVQTIKVRLDPILSREELEKGLTETERRRAKEALRRESQEFD